jgi:hypothetical protein
MANVFKNAKTISVSNSSADTVYTTPAATKTIILGAMICNKNAASRDVTVTWTDSSDSDNVTSLLNEVPVPGDSSLEVLSGQKYVLEAGDLLKCLSSDDSASLDITVGVMEIT